MKAAISFLLLFLVFFSSQTEVLAHCPLCVAGAGAGLSLSRVLGVDDSITGVWIAAVFGAISFWTASALGKVKLKSFTFKTFPFLRLLTYFVIFAVTIWFFYGFGLVETHGKILGLDKLTFGIVTGGTAFYLVDLANDFVIAKNGKVFFAYQRIIVSLGAMLFLSLAIYILINYYI